MREQWCCGGPAAEMGYVDLALKHAEHNVEDWRAVGAKRIIAPDPHDFIAFTEDYPKYFGDDYEFEIVLGVELVNDLVKDGQDRARRTPVERTVTYHDPCRLNKRKGVHEAPRELLARDPRHHLQRRRPRHAVVLLLRRRRRAADREARDHRPRSAAAASAKAARARGRHADQRLPVVGAPALHGRRTRPTSSVMDLFELRRASARGSSREPRRLQERRSTTHVIDELRAIIGDDARVLRRPSARARSARRVPAPFPVHRWAEHFPDVAILPKTAQEVSEVVKLANRLQDPDRPARRRHRARRRRRPAARRDPDRLSS